MTSQGRDAFDYVGTLQLRQPEWWEVSKKPRTYSIIGPIKMLLFLLRPLHFCCTNPESEACFSRLWEEEVRRRRERTAAPFPDQSLPICSWPKLQEGEVSTVSQVWSLSYCAEHFNYWMESISYHLKWLSNYYLKVTRAVLGTGFLVRDKEKTSPTE